MAHQNKSITSHLKMPIASQMSLQNWKSKIALNDLPLHKSHSINKNVEYAQKSDSKESEQSEQLHSIKLIFETKSNNQFKFLKLGTKVKKFQSQMKPTQKHLAFCLKSPQNSSLITLPTLFPKCQKLK